ncbi:MAG: flippase-like domain-containing protein [Acidobacteriota bacterium]|nr:MAG: flippase-like domain-containing protein [Acidobacteriota bacterium]
MEARIATMSVSPVNETSSDPSAAPPTRRRRAAVRGMLGFALAGGAIALLAWQIWLAGPSGIAARIASASMGWLLLAAMLTAGRFVVFAARLAVMTRRLVPCRVSGLLPIVLASQLIVLLPAVRAGALWLRAHLASRRFGGETTEHLGPNIVDQVLQAISWVVAAAALLPVLAWHAPGGSTTTLGLGIAGALLAAFAGAVLVHGHRRRLQAWLALPRPGRRGRLARAGMTTLRGAGRLAVDRGALSAGLGGGLLFALLTGLAQAAALEAVGQTAPWWLSLMAVAVGSTIGTAVSTPGGLGVTEAAQVGFLVGQGIPLEGAASGVLLARGLHFAIVVFGGVPALAYSYWRLGRRGAPDAVQDPEGAPATLGEPPASGPPIEGRREAMELPARR